VCVSSREVQSLLWRGATCGAAWLVLVLSAGAAWREPGGGLALSRAFS